MLQNKIIVMKMRYIIFPAIITASLVIGSCGDTANNNQDIKAADSPAVDSAMPAHVQDPSTAFPQPPVTGSQVDSSRTQDSTDKKGDTSRNRKPAKG
jgi:hypothetical protein